MSQGSIMTDGRVMNGDDKIIHCGGEMKMKGWPIESGDIFRKWSAGGGTYRFA